ncbi:MAG TPA: exodeoxyribonuclease III [Candidatus Kapabacteria bacterium]|nr:exodeoxyribonuclease III [Candidatus Kapabacteria bacterium]
MLKIASWNINGIRAAEKKGLKEYIADAKPDILCLQETKANIDQLPDSLVNIDGYSSHFVSGEKKGYSGVAIYSKKKPNDIVAGCGKPKFDVEGRVIRADFDEFILYNIYYPNGGRGPERVQYKLEFYHMILQQWQDLRDEGKKLILTGDFNTAHSEIDLARPDENRKTTGFLPEERAWLDKIEALGYVDTFRVFNADPEWYTYWDQITRARERNVGWRIDYFWVTPDVMSFVTDSPIKMDVTGSDHCPIELILDLPKN